MSANLTPADVAAEIGKSERWVKRNARNLPHHKFGRTYRFSREDVAAIIAAHQHHPETEADTFRPISRRRAS
jgi:excisionase family DNA binding protein